MRPGDMTLSDMIQTWKLPLNVSPNQFCEVAGIGQTRFYELAKEGAIRIRKNGRSTTVPVEDLYRLLRGDQAAA
ncbi:helix-turn-helix domain-containing protein [Bradyrhizobium zhanjiangense]|uniref:DNA-binding protein n=1 Tax=Bradyrhizobium zhanjiangense TaxID=1325107 RepID=A0ABY0DKC7_9BRAD|nr:helix-turn-helix domain-containing protein [Bradyrhizobium zhanjiangense]RXG93044.1 DNA-binding protein [Bradyrhizobium zhanjiangense]